MVQVGEKIGSWEPAVMAVLLNAGLLEAEESVTTRQRFSGIYKFTQKSDNYEKSAITAKLCVQSACSHFPSFVNRYYMCNN